MDKYISLYRVSAGYNLKQVIKDVSLTVQKGEILTLLGANGEGKTTLLKVLCGLKSATDGTVTIGENNIDKIVPGELAKYIAYVPQNYQTGLDFSVLDMVVLGCIHKNRLFSGPGWKDIKKSIKILSDLGIDHLQNKKFNALSGGEQRLVMLARAVNQGADFIILDEPVSNLDLGNQIKVLNIIKSLSTGGIGIIMTSHFPEHSLWINSRVAVLKDGLLIADDKAERVITSRLLSDIYDTEIVVHHHDNGRCHCEPAFIKELKVI